MHDPLPTHVKSYRMASRTGSLKWNIWTGYSYGGFVGSVGVLVCQYLPSIFERFVTSEDGIGVHGML